MTVSVCLILMQSLLSLCQEPVRFVQYKLVSPHRTANFPQKLRPLQPVLHPLLSCPVRIKSKLNDKNWGFFIHSTYETNCYVLINFVSGAIDLAAKSAGIIPGSPCREVEAPSIDKAIVESEEAMDSTPAAPELEPDLLDQEPSEVRTNCLP